MNLFMTPNAKGIRLRKISKVMKAISFVLVTRYADFEFSFRAFSGEIHCLELTVIVKRGLGSVEAG